MTRTIPGLCIVCLALVGAIAPGLTGTDGSGTRDSLGQSLQPTARGTGRPARIGSRPIWTVFSISYSAKRRVVRRRASRRRQSADRRSAVEIERRNTGRTEPARGRQDIGETDPKGGVRRHLLGGGPRPPESEHRGAGRPNPEERDVTRRLDVGQMKTDHVAIERDGCVHIGYRQMHFTQLVNGHHRVDSPCRLSGLSPLMAGGTRGSCLAHRSRRAEGGRQPEEHCAA